MGIQGLFSYIQEYVEGALEWHKLRDCKVVIDGNNMAFEIFNNSKELVPFYGGDYDKFALCIQERIRKLRKCKVQPYIVMDGGHPVQRDKFATLLDRHREQTSHCINMFPRKASRSKNFPLSGLYVFSSVVQKMGVPVIQSDFEADDDIVVIAKELGAYILSNDSDFYLVGVPLILLNSINIKTIPREEYDNGEFGYYIPCYKFNPEEFCSVLNIPVNYLPLLAPLLGNDYMDISVIGSFYRKINHLKPTSRSITWRHKTIISVLKWLSKQDVKPSKVLDKVLNMIPWELKYSERNKFHEIMAMYSPADSLIKSWFLDHNPECPIGSTKLCDQISLPKSSTKLTTNSNGKTAVNSPRSSGEIPNDCGVDGFLPSSLKCELECTCQKRSKMTLLRNAHFPDWFVKAYRLGLFPPVTNDILNQDYMFSQPLIELQTSTSVYLPLEGVVTQIRAILWSTVAQSRLMQQSCPQEPLIQGTPLPSGNHLPVQVAVKDIMNYPHQFPPVQPAVNFTTRESNEDRNIISDDDSDCDVMIEEEIEYHSNESSVKIAFEDVNPVSSRMNCDTPRSDDSIVKSNDMEKNNELSFCTVYESCDSENEYEDAQEYVDFKDTTTHTDPIMSKGIILQSLSTISDSNTMIDNDISELNDESKDDFISDNETTNQDLDIEDDYDEDREPVSVLEESDDVFYKTEIYDLKINDNEYESEDDTDNELSLKLDADDNDGFDEDDDNESYNLDFDDDDDDEFLALGVDDDKCKYENDDNEESSDDSCSENDDCESDCIVEEVMEICNSGGDEIIDMNEHIFLPDNNLIFDELDKENGNSKALAKGFKVLPTITEITKGVSTVQIMGEINEYDEEEIRQQNEIKIPAKRKKVRRTANGEKDDEPRVRVNIFKVRSELPYKSFVKKKRLPKMAWYIRKSDYVVGRIMPCPTIRTFGYLPTLFQVETLSVVEKRNLFYNICSLKIEFEDDSLPADIEFILYCICFWRIKYKNFHTKSIVSSFLMCILMFKVLDGKTGFNVRKVEVLRKLSLHKIKKLIDSGALPDPSTLSISELIDSLTTEECLLAKAALLQFHSANSRVNKKTFNRMVVHAFSGYQVTVYFLKMLNSLLCFPFPNIAMNEFWSGTFCYNVNQKLFSRKCGLGLALSAVFTSNTRIIHLFMRLYAVLEAKLNLPAIKEPRNPSTSLRQLAKTRRKVLCIKSPEDMGIHIDKRKKKVRVMELQCDRLKNPTENQIMNMSENKFSALLFS